MGVGNGRADAVKLQLLQRKFGRAQSASSEDGEKVWSRDIIPRKPHTLQSPASTAKRGDASESVQPPARTDTSVVVEIHTQDGSAAVSSVLSRDDARFAHAA